MIDWVGLGVTGLTSVIPPDAELSPNSKIAPESRGKAPGMPGPTGWYGYDWRSAGPWHSEDLETARAQGANIGVRGDWFPALDVDVDDQALAELVIGHIALTFGRPPRRHSRAPRAVFMFRSETPLPRRQLYVFRDGVKVGLVEFLGSGQQYVVEGKHQSGVEYRWDPEPTTADSIPGIAAGDLDYFLGSLGTFLERKGYTTKVSGSSDGEAKSAAELLAPVGVGRAEFMRLAELIPNEGVDYGEWTKIGYAFRGAAGPDRDADGFEAWSAWSDKAAGEPTDKSREDYWQGFHPERVGWGYLISLAGSEGANLAAQLAFSVVESAVELAPKPKSKRRIWRASEIKIRGVRWLWDQRIPRNMLTLIVGDGGVGKGLTWVWLAKQVTRGTFGKPGNVLVVQKEATREYEIAPRLKAAGADMDRVIIPDVPDWVFPGATQELGEMIQNYEIDLVVFDPLDSFVGASVDSHVNASVRTGFATMVDTLDKTGAAGVATLHTNKRSETTGTARINGSVAWRNMSRSCFIVGPAPDDDGIVMAQDKKNLAPRQPSLRYRIATVPVETDIGRKDVAYVVDPEECEYDVAAVFAGGKKAGGPRGRAAGTATEDCAAWLMEKLRAATGPVSSKELQEEAQKSFGWGRGAWGGALKIVRDHTGKRPKKAGLSGSYYFEPLDEPSAEGLL